MRSPVGEVLARALAPAGRRDGGGHDVLEAEPGAGAAVVAGRPAAVLDAHPRQRVLPVAPEEVAVQPRRDVVPRQRLVARRGRGGTPRRGSGPRRRGPPPTARGRSARTTPGRCRRPARPVRSPRPCGGRPGWPAPRRPRRPGRASGWSGRGSRFASARSSATLRSSSADGVHAEPLEGRVRLGHEAADGGHHRDRLLVAPADLDAAGARARRCRARPRRARSAGR